MRVVCAQEDGIYADPACYNPNNPPILDHAVLVVGYHFEGVGSNTSYFIILNSWGTGEGGSPSRALALTAPQGQGGHTLNHRVREGTMRQGHCAPGAGFRAGLVPVMACNSVS